MIITTIGRSNFPEWDGYLLGRDIQYPYFLSSFREVIEETFGHQAVYLIAWDGTNVRGVLPIFFMRSRLFGRLFATLPFFTYGGVVADDPVTRAALLNRGVEEARCRNASFWIIRQGDEGQQADVEGRGGFYLRSDKANVLLSLPGSEQELWGGFQSKLRSQIRRAEKNGLVCRDGDQEEIGSFYRVFSSNMRDLGTPVYPLRFFSSILEKWEKSRIFTIWKGGIPVGGAFLIGWRDRLEIPWASTDRKYNSLAPNMLLYASVLRYAIREGYKVFDFGRSTPGEGTHKFKLQWGGQEHRLPWLYWAADGEPPVLNRRNRKFTLLSELWKKMPLPAAQLLGPLVIRNIP
jgi:FemAB-related protein (PEP-CTERM system-associated)